MNKKLLTKIAVVSIAGTMTVGTFIAGNAQGNVSSADSVITDGSNSTSLNVNKTTGAGGT